MNLSRALSFLLVLVMLVFTLASCNPSGDNKVTTENGDPSNTTTLPGGGDDPSPDDNWDELYDIITIKEALEIAQGATTPTTERYYISGVITKIDNANYGAMYVEDETGSIYVYGTYSADGEIGYSAMDDKPVKGDTVLLHCTLQNYNGTMEVKNARLIDFKKADKGDIDISSYTEMSINDAREADVDTKVKISGIVARITYANGMKPSGVYIVDGTNSIYVYDGDIAGQVKIGNKITVLGTRTYWILETETNNANKFGYKGCCQLDEATLYDNDNGSHKVDFSWCEEMSVKNIVEIPVTENVTTTIFKTTALVKKVPGKGFTNYYFYDLDGKTGGYAYTHCNGSDFTWLDKFDGKICTIYLSPINAKSTSSDCLFRFLPVEVIDEGFTFDSTKTAEHVVEYYGIGQFLSIYTGNPLLELETSVSSELLGFENVKLSYSSSNTDVAFFTEEDGKVIFNCGENGKATVTITATFGDQTHSETVEITVYAPSESDGITILEAFQTTVGEKVTVEGIVGPSVVNQSAFYLIDSTGAIAVKVDASAFEGLAIGQRVVVEGTVSITKDGGGQLCLDSATIIANFYGKEDYSTDSFITGKTFAELTKIADSPEATIPVYVVKATVEVVETDYFTSIKLIGGGASLTLYSSSANQYSWLKQFAGEEVTMELALCDWNAKGLKGAVLAVITEDGKIYNELNFK